MKREGREPGRRWVLPAQLLASAAILTLLLREAEPAVVWEALSQADLRWVAVATLTKMASLTLHELRLWVAFTPSSIGSATASGTTSSSSLRP